MIPQIEPMKHTRFLFPENAGKTAIMVRHAERDPIEKMADALVPTLTAKGKSDSFEMGRSLTQHGPYNIFHSPVPRCRETAEYILEGIAQSNFNSTIVGSLLELGGPYITGNWDGIVATIEKLGHSIFIRRWFDNELPPDLIMPLPEAARIQSGILVGQLRASSLSSIHITHDWNIMIMREYYFHLRHEDIGDPDYLDGVLAFIAGGTLHLRYHEHESTIDLSDFEP